MNITGEHVSAFSYENASLRYEICRSNMCCGPSPSLPRDLSRVDVIAGSQKNINVSGRDKMQDTNSFYETLSIYKLRS